MNYDEKYSVNIKMFLQELRFLQEQRRYIPRCRECTTKRRG